MGKNINSSNVELPSTVTLIKSTILAIVVAGVILLTIVLPAEYGIDPSGVGDMLGLTTMGKIKVSLAEESEAVSMGKNESIDSKETTVSETKGSFTEVIHQDGEMAISLKPNEGKELKLYMRQGDEVNYSWWTNGEKISYDAHTDSGEYHSYNKGSKEKDSGILKAVYDGRHGWYWKNRTSEIVTITLRVDGKYSDFKEES